MEAYTLTMNYYLILVDNVDKTKSKIEMMIEVLHDIIDIQTHFCYSQLCSYSLICSGGIRNLSICSCSMRAHFSRDSMMDHGDDIDATSSTSVSAKLSCDRANFNRLLCWVSPSRIHTPSFV